ncbi:MAG: AbrB/MazE/SpoVT family DNA-binding domain-containing protein, partial [Candidatus Nitrosotenuis sp.]
CPTNSVKLQTRRNRVVGDKEYLKWYVEFPPDLIKEVGWREGMELDSEIKENKVILKPKKHN